MSLLCILKRFQNEHLDSKGFELGCVFLRKDRCEVITPWSKGRNWSGKGCGEGKKGKRGALVNTNTFWTGRVRGACKQCSRIQEGSSQAKGLWY